MRIIQPFLSAVLVAVLSLAASRAQAAGSDVRLTLQHRTIRPGETQMVSIRGLPSGPYQIMVFLPNGETLASPVRISKTSGVLGWSFVQPPRSITHESRQARVQVGSGGQSYQVEYTVAFNAIDIVAPIGPVPENSQVTIWVHARARARVVLQLSRPGSTTLHRVVTGAHGWVAMHTRIENADFPFKPITVSVVASLAAARAPQVARADFEVLPFQFHVSLQGAQVLHQMGGSWTPTSTVHPGEEIHAEVSSCITEPAGNHCQCVAGFMTLVQGNAPRQMAPLQCAGSSPATMVADLQLSAKLLPGPAEVDFDVMFENASAHLAVPVTIAGG